MRFTDWLAGYCDVEICGWYGERLLTAAAREGIEIRGVFRLNEKRMTVRINMIDEKNFFAEYYALKAILPSDMSVSVIKKDGLIPWLIRHRLRSGFVAGFAFAAVAAFMMMSLIWSVDVTGLYEISPFEFRAELEKNGLFTGSFSRGHDLDSVRLALMRRFDKIAYVTLNIDGSRLKVDVIEGELPPERPDAKASQNIVAAADGVLIVAEAYEGVKKVSAWQAVKKGELLVSGIFPSKEIGYRLVRADAKMMAYTRKTFEAFTPFNITEYNETDNYTYKYTVSIFNITFDIPFIGMNSYLHSEESHETVHLTAGGSVLPISVKTTKITELDEKKVVLETDDAKALLTAEIEENMRVTLNGIEIVEKTVSFSDTQSGLYCCTDITVIDDISLAQPIYKETK